jgi:hypothetical protein
MSTPNDEIERTAIWLAYSKKCVYCGDLIQLRDLQIDHILPRSLNKDQAKLERLKIEYGLSSGFQIDSVSNYLPTHGRCNLRKRDKIFDESSARYYLKIAEDKIEAINRLISGLQLQAAKDSILASVRCAFDSGNVNLLDLMSAVSNVKGFPLSTRIEFVDGEWNGDDLAGNVDGLLDRQILFGETLSIDGVEFINASGSSIVIRTCREYRAARAAGYYAYTTFAMEMEAFLEAADAVLDAVSLARLPVISYLSNPHVGVADINLLPIGLLPWIGPEYEEMIAGIKALTLKELNLSGEISIIDVSSTHLHFEFRGCGAVIRELLRADLDGDGLEEILIQYYIYAIGGTFGASMIGTLRRPYQDGLFEYVPNTRRLT